MTRGHQVMVPDELWALAQARSGMENPAPWLRERLFVVLHQSERDVPMFDVAPVLHESAPPASAEEREDRDWSHPMAPNRRAPGRFLPSNQYPFVCVSCGTFCGAGTRNAYVFTAQNTGGLQMCFACGQRYHVYWWGSLTKGGPWEEGS